MKKYGIRFCVSLIMTLAMFSQSCKKDSSNDEGSGNTDQGNMEVRMTDGPGSFDRCLVDIQEVWVNVEGKGWVSVPMTRRGAYNILLFNNGNDTLIARANLSSGKIKQVKLVLGSNNKIVVNGVVYDIDMSVMSQSDLIINVDEEIEANVKFTIWVDIDAGRSFFYHVGKWKFKPWMRCFVHKKSGAIKGDVNPDNAAFYAYAVPTQHMNDTFGTYLRSDGTFKIWGLKPGQYHVDLVDKVGLKVKSINSVEVSAGKETDIGGISIP